ncbi:MAG: hypothetical protein JO326_12625 [Acetobacteraceae bacterium]|nr:hypothetical protein [Acetobacteraceae bacterium]
MKAIFMAIGLGLLAADAATPAIADDVQTATDGTCPSTQIFSRVSDTLPTTPQCCDGKLRCSQLLSTSVLQLPHHPART